jgi:serine-type D-Ala-D-Ala carboxypeptidase (penicillin-binding protein 5/6)
MTERSVLLDASRTRRAEREARVRRALRRRRARRSAILLAAGLIALLAFTATVNSDPSLPRTPPAQRLHAPRESPAAGYGAGLVPARERVTVRFAKPLRSGVLFDVDTGKVLWERRPARVLPIASLTKMMTALVVVAHAKPSARVLITRQAVHFSGSGVGLLPLRKHARLETLLYGLLLPSGNDAAIALAQHVAGTQRRFIAMMNSRALAMHLRCTHFSTVSGILDRGNHSCATDLAVIAHAVLKQRVLAPIVAARDAVLPLPIKGGKLYLYNNNPLLVLQYPGTDGVKTGFTTLAGQCLVAAARRGHAWLGVVLLHSADPAGQAQKLLSAGFAALHAPPR